MRTEAAARQPSRTEQGRSSLFSRMHAGPPRNVALLQRAQSPRGLGCRCLARLSLSCPGLHAAPGAIHVCVCCVQEKASEEGFNLACILTLPAYQRRVRGRSGVQG